MKTRMLLPLLLILTACSAQQAPIAGGSASSMAPTVMLTYTDPQSNFSMLYPEGWTVKQDTSLPPLNRVSKGVGFVPPDAMTRGTAWIDGMVFMEKTAAPCPEFAESQTVKLGENEYVHSSSSDAGAGNLYLMDSYVTSRKETGSRAIAPLDCYNLTLYQHRCNLGKDCGEEHALPFDDTNLQQQFRTMLGSFRTL